jgi:nucleoid-associated protein Lsr2
VISVRIRRRSATRNSTGTHDAYSKLLASNQRVPIRFIGTFPYDCVSQAEEGVMAQRVEVILEDDIDGGPANETVRFALNGTSYEIDLSNENAQALRGALGKYVEHARKASGPSRQARGPRKRVDTSAVRAWAKEQGMKINERGRIPASVMKDYEAAQES